MKKLIIWESIGALVIIIAGTLLHSAYNDASFWLVAWIAPVNESVWEHLKIGIWPVFFFALIEYPFIKSYAKNFVEAKAAQAYTTSISTLVIFYTYTSIVGYNMLPMDILTFIIAVIIGQVVSYMILSKKELDEFFGQLALSGIYVMVGAVIYSTYFPPKLPLFMDSLTGLYGMSAKRGVVENVLFFTKNTLLAILIVLVGYFLFNITTPFRMWSLNRKMDKIISLLEKIAKK
jgi:hypothetical protein